MTRTQRLRHTRRFYRLLAQLERKLGGARRLLACTGRMAWPRRGVYFFMEPGEARADSGSGPRIVRVGTHALKPGAGTRLWTRLHQHRGNAGAGAGRHRGSVFRRHVGKALINRDGVRCPSWDRHPGTAPPSVIRSERSLEMKVSQVIGTMPFVWLAVEDEPGPKSRRGCIERNAIALLSNCGKDPIDPPSRSWLGFRCGHDRISPAGLWNSNHVDEDCNPAFLDVLERLIGRMKRTG